MPPIWVSFCAHDSLNKGPFFGRFSLNIVAFLSETGRKWSKMCSFPPRPMVKVGMMQDCICCFLCGELRGRKQ